MTSVLAAPVLPAKATKPRSTSFDQISMQGSYRPERPAPLLLPAKSTLSSFPVVARGDVSPQKTVTGIQARIKEDEARRGSLPSETSLREMAEPSTPVPRLFQAPWVRRPKSVAALTPPSRPPAPVIKRPHSPKQLPQPATRAVVAPAQQPQAQPTSSEGPAPSSKSLPPAVNDNPSVSGANIARRASDALMARRASLPSIACAYCTATGVTPAWRRDKTGRPLCGKCCDQLRRRMNPRYAVATAAKPAPAAQPRHAVRGVANAEAVPSPVRADTGRRAASPPYPRPRQLPPPPKPVTAAPPTVVEAKLNVPYPTQSSAHTNRPTRDSPNKHDRELDLVSLPPISELDRIAGSYAAYHSRPSNITFAARRRSDVSRRTVISEEDVRHARLALLEGRRWILGMLEETTELLKALDEVPHHGQRQREDSRYHDVRLA